jgi:ABC-type glycerol-3-phosphate transport system permease component
MKKYGTLIYGTIGWIIAIIIFFPIFWMTITAFKTERGAYSPDLSFRSEQLPGVCDELTLRLYWLDAGLFPFRDSRRL